MTGVGLLMGVCAEKKIKMGLLGLLAVWGGTGCRDGRPELGDFNALAEALGTTRFIEARVTGGFPHAAWNQRLEQPEKRGVDALRLAQAESALTHAYTTHSVGVRAHLEGVIHLVHQRLDQSVAAFRRAVDEDDSHAVFLNDLAAAYLARANRQDRGFDLVWALEFADRACLADPGLEEAAFNKALALEKLALNEEARRQWDRYLKMDAGSGWAKEARMRRESLTAPVGEFRWKQMKRQFRAAAEQEKPPAALPIDRGYLQDFREFGMYELMQEWADASGRAAEREAQRKLDALRLLADSLVRSNGEATLLHSVQAIQKAGPGQLAAIIRGVERLKRARELQEKDREKAAELFIQAARAFDKGVNPMAHWARLDLAVCRYSVGSYGDAIELLASVRAAVQEEDYPALIGRIHWIWGLTELRLGNYVSAIQHYSRSRAGFAELNEVNNLVAANNFLSGAYQALAEDDVSWRYRVQALKALPAIRDWRRIRQVYRLALESALWHDAPHAALFFADGVLDRAQLDNPLAQSIGLWWRALVYDRLGETQLALNDLDKAREYARELPDQEFRRGIMADIDFADGSLHVHTRPKRAARVLERALSSKLEKRGRYRLIPIYRELAQASINLGDQSGAEKYLTAGIHAFEQQRDNVFDNWLKYRFCTRFETIFDKMVRFQLERGNEAKAFFFAEKGRVNFWHSPTPGVDRQEEPSAPANLEARLARDTPPSTVLVAYNLSSDRLAIWLVYRGRAMVALDQPASGIPMLVRRFRAACRVPGSDQARQAYAKDLHDVLIKPWLSRVPKDAHLVFVPDKALHALPFSALVDRDSGRYLIEDHAISVVPSVSDFLRSASRPFSSDALLTRPLIIGDPDYDRETFPDFPSLEHAKNEARAIKDIHNGSLHLEGPKAVKARFLIHAETATLIHFAGHGVDNPNQPGLSYLILAVDKDAGDDGRLFAHQLKPERLANVRLVILSACGPADLREFGGFSNLARFFLNAGVPGVVAGLWPVADLSAKKFFVFFHQCLKDGDAPHVALRKAKVECIRGEDPSLRSPAAWAVFRHWGAAGATPP